jgi:penicillin-binding protein 2
MSTGGIKIGSWFFPDWKAGGHGLTDVRKALAESVNTFFYAVGGGYGDIQGLGIDRLKKYAELFGLNHQLGIDLPGEASGFIPSKVWKESVKKEQWYIGDTYHLSIGQGDLLVTPLQVSSYMAAVANGGILFKPQIVNKITDASGNLVKELKPEVIRENFIKPEYLQVVREGLRQAVTAGSSRALADLPFTSAGKTGTAQFGNENKTHAWFTAFAPYENPEIVITVIVEGGGQGNELALPIAKQALQWWFSHK